MGTALINPQKSCALNEEGFAFPCGQNLEAELERLLAEGDPLKIAAFLAKHPGFLLHQANEKLNLRLQTIYAGAPATDSLQAPQTRLLQDIHYLCRLDHNLRTLPLPVLYQNRKQLVQQINSLVPKKNEQLRAEAHRRILRRLVHRHLNEQCQWLRNKETQISRGLERALNNLFYEGFQIENEHPRYLEDTIRYALPVLEQLGPYLQEVSNLSHQAVLLASTRIGRTNPTLNALAAQINTQGQMAPLTSNSGINSTLETYGAVYEHLLETPATKAIETEIKREKHREAVDLSYLPYHPLLHAGNE
jgi:hypothetical protein